MHRCGAEQRRTDVRISILVLRKTSRISILVLRKERENTCEQCVFGGNQKLPLLGGDGEVFILIRAAIEGADTSDLHNCTLYTLRFSHKHTNCAA